MTELSFDGFADPSVDHADFAYPADSAGLRLTLSVFADRPGLRAELRDDAVEAGFRINHVAGLDGLVNGEPRALGDVVVVDCPQVDGAIMAGLSRLDQRAARVGARLVVSTSVDALDDVFGCLDQSQPQLLVAPSRAERVIALGQIVSRQSGRVSELSEADRLVLLRLSEQVSAIGARLERLNGGDLADRMPATARLNEASALFRFAPRRPLSGRRPCRRRGWCAASSASGRPAPSSSRATFSVIPPGTCCSI